MQVKKGNGITCKDEAKLTYRCGSMSWFYQLLRLDQACLAVTGDICN